MKTLARILINIAIILPLFGTGISHAEDIVSSAENVTVLPAKFELSSTPGQKLTQSLKIINDSGNDYLYALSMDDISVTGENGEVTIGNASSQFSSSLSSWMTADQPSGKLEAKSTKIINISIDVPSDASQGGKYASIVIGIDKIERNFGESSAVAKVVSLVMMTVAGDYAENAKLISFEIAPKSDTKFSFITRIRDQGDAHVKPEGTIVITNLFGTKIDEVAFDGDNVLPGSTRKTTPEWKPKKALFGVYTATLVATYGQANNQQLSGSLQFSRFPFWPSFLILAALCALMTAIVANIQKILRRRKGTRA